MNSDEKVRVSLEQALEVQNALRRNRLTLQDLKLLTSGLNMSHALVALQRDAQGGELMLDTSDSILDMDVLDFLNQAQCPTVTQTIRSLTKSRFEWYLRGELVADLVRKTPEDLMGLPMFGKVCLSFVREALKEHGLHLRGDA